MLKIYIALSLCITSPLYSMLPSEKIYTIFQDKKLAQIVCLGQQENQYLRISLLRTSKGEVVEFVNASESENSIEISHMKNNSTVQTLKTHLQSRLNSDIPPNQKLFFAAALHDFESFKAELNNSATGEAVHFDKEVDHIFGSPNDNVLFYLARLVKAHEEEGEFDSACMNMLQLACVKIPHLMKTLNKRSFATPASILERSRDRNKKGYPEKKFGYELYKELTEKQVQK